MKQLCIYRFIVATIGFDPILPELSRMQKNYDKVPLKISQIASPLISLDNLFCICAASISFQLMFTTTGWINYII